MKKYIIIFLIISVSCLSFSQMKKDYTIMLKFNSSKNEMSAFYFGSKENQSLSFIIAKLEQKNPRYSLGVDKNGKLEKRIRGSSSSGCCSLTLTHNTNKHKQQKILKINPKNNIISHKDFMTITFENFLEVLRNAKKVYVVDSGKEDETSLYYDVYEVSF